MARQYIERWLDYRAAKLTGSAVKAAGYQGVIRYIDAPKLLKTKHTDRAEYQSMLAAGIKVMLVFEVDVDDADGGYARGVAYGQRAKAGADFIGYTGKIFFCNDRVSNPDPVTWRAYLNGAASVLGKDRVGAYGFGGALDLAVGYANAFWQAGRQSDLRDHAGIYQWNNGRVYVSGVECDLNYVYTDYTQTSVSNPLLNGADMSDAYPQPKLLDSGAYRYHVTFSNWDKVNGRYLALSTGFTGCSFQIWIQLSDGSYVNSTAQIPSGSYNKVLNGTLAPDNVHWIGIPAGTQSVSVEILPSNANGVPGVTVFTDGK